MDGTCARHQFERSTDLCHTCGEEFCADCLVYPFGPAKSPYCVACALAASGVRTNAARAPRVSRRELRRRARERELAEQARRPAPETGLDDGDGATIDLGWSTGASVSAGVRGGPAPLPAPPGSRIPF